MATEPQEQPSLGQLRLAWQRAIAAATRAEAAYLQVGHGDSRAWPLSNAVSRAWDAERVAGRAFLAALDEQDPCCRVCGCTYLFACRMPDGPCAWVPGEAPPRCTACAAKAATP